MVRLEIVYTNMERPVPYALMLLGEPRRDGLGWAYHLVMTLTSGRALLKKWNTRKLWRGERRLTAGINHCRKAYARGAVGVGELTAAYAGSISISLLVLNGWRIRRLPDTNICVVESS